MSIAKKKERKEKEFQSKFSFISFCLIFLLIQLLERLSKCLIARWLFLAKKRKGCDAHSRNEYILLQNFEATYHEK